MKQFELYKWQIDRSLNPAVSADGFDEKTIKTEIEEYVFTDEIIQGLYNILVAIRNRDKSHDGIWIDGYFGSGKSHFLKYLNYCLDKRFSEAAMNRLLTAVKETDPILSNLEIQPFQVIDLMNWLKKAEVEVILFNIGTVNNIRVNRSNTFLDAFWNRFNKHCGFNGYNISLALHLEKNLAQQGKLQQFKDLLKTEGFDWDEQSYRLATNRLDLVLRKAKEIDPDFSVQRDLILNDATNISVESFADDLCDYLKNKNDDFRLLFLVDEVSQFVGVQGDLLLQLQEIVTMFHNRCGDKVWAACTAQQALSDLAQACNFNSGTDQFGKIMGRFEVRVSLEGTKADYITQKRILDKNGSGELELGRLYDADKEAIETMLHLPASYYSFTSKDNFIDYYPFIPYQFKLMLQVFNSFDALDYVNKQVRGTERSMINVTHSTAMLTMNDEIGHFISFDQFYNAMFKESLTPRARIAKQKADDMADGYLHDKVFAKRVVDVMFMICNLSVTDRLLFPATTENITTLMLRDVNEARATLNAAITDVLSFLCDKNIMYKSKNQDGLELYDFYTEDEIDVANLINNERIGFDELDRQLYNEVFSYLGIKEKESFYNNSFKIGLDIDGYRFLSRNGEDMLITILIDPAVVIDGDTYLNNDSNSLMFYLTPAYHDSTSEFLKDFRWYCRVQNYLTKSANGASEARAKANDKFRDQAKRLYTEKIQKQIADMLDSCKVFSGQNALSSKELGNAKGKERYRRALDAHFANYYYHAKKAAGSTVPKDIASLRAAVMKPIDANYYATAPLGDAEQVLNTFIKTQPDISLADIQNRYAKAPYGWSPIATSFIVNELARRHLFDWYVKGDRFTKLDAIAAAIGNPKDMTLRPAAVISSELVNRFIGTWNVIYKNSTTFKSKEASEVFDVAKTAIAKLIANHAKTAAAIGNTPFSKFVQQYIDMLSNWNAERDETKFFNLVISEKDLAKGLCDVCAEITDFATDQKTHYDSICNFIKDNQDNFAYLNESCLTDLENLKAIETDEHPFDRLNAYKKLRDKLHQELNAIRQQYAAMVKDAFNQSFDQLERLCNDNKVNTNILPYRESTIANACASQSIDKLKNSTDITEFFNKWVNIIMERAQGGKRKSVKFNRFSNGSPCIIKTADELDAYLQDLKQRMLSALENNDLII